MRQLQKKLAKHFSKIGKFIVAVKVLAPELAANATARKRFLKEAQAAAAVSHDHVVTIFAVEDHAEDGGQHLPYLVMEFVDGQSLQQKIDRGGQLELKEILRIGHQVAAGLSAAHLQGLIHRDIKPANILLQNGVQRVQITDFGLARAVDDVGVTRTGEVTGTPQYMSPEQAQRQRVDPRSDLFSLGSVLYAMCTGRSPFRADTSVAALRRVCDDTPRPIREINPDIPQWLADVIDCLLEKKPEDRYQSAAEVAELLAKCLAHWQDVGPSSMLGIVVPQRKQRAEKPSIRRSRPLGKWAVAALLLLALGLTFSVTEATGVTRLSNTVIRIMTGEGTLVVEVDDPSVEVSLDGEELSITGAGLQEIKLRPGQYKFKATKDGQPIEQKLVSISRGGREVVRVTRQAPDVPSTGAIAEPGTFVVLNSHGKPVGKIRRVRQLDGHTKAVTAIAFFNDGRRILTSSHDSTVRQWDVLTGEMQEIRPVRIKGGSKPIALAPDQQHVALEGDEIGSIVLFNMETKEIVQQFVGHTENVGYLEFSPSGRQLLSRSHDSSIRLWDVTSGKELSRFDVGPSWAAPAATFSPDGSQILYGHTDQVILWDIKTESPIHKLPMKAYSDQILQVAFSPDGQRLAASTLPGAIHVWNTTTGKLEGTIYVHAPRPFIRFSPNGKQLISSTTDKTLRIWSLDSFTETHRFTAKENTLNHFAMSPDGRHIVAGSGMYFDEEKREWVGVGDNRLSVFESPESVWTTQTADEPITP